MTRLVVPFALLLAVLLPDDAPAGDAVSVRILEPERAELLEGHTVLVALVRPPRGAAIDRVSFRVDGRLLGEDAEAPFEATWDSIDTARDHLIRVTAHFDDGSRAYALLSIPVLGMVTRATVVGDAPDRVRLAVTFVDGKGEPLTDVTVDEVRVFEDGRPQTIEDFGPDDRPLAVQLLLDSSDSTRKHWDDLARSTRLFAETLRPEDRAGVEAFSDRIYPLAPLGSAAAEIENATSRFQDWGGSTWLYDALSRAALITLGHESRGRRALVVLTDGDDRGSTFSSDDALEYLDHADIQVHSVVWFPDNRTSTGVRRRQSIFGRAHRILERIVRTTGGQQVDFADRPLEEIFLRIGESLRTQYLITYTSLSRKPAGEEREVEVRLKRRGRGDVRYRRVHHGGETLGQLLAERIRSGEEVSRRLAIQTAALFHDTDVVDALIETVVEGPDPTSGLAQEARLSLLSLGTVAVPPLRDLLESASEPARRSSAQVLADLFVVLDRSGDGATMDEGLLLLGRGSRPEGEKALERLLDAALLPETRRGIETLLGRLAPGAP